MTMHQEAGELSALIDVLIEAAPMLVRRHREHFAAVDWGAVSGRQIDRLNQRFVQHRTAMPAWLAREIVLAGHRAPDMLRDSLSAELRILDQLAAVADASEPIPADLVRQAVEIVQQSSDPDAIAAIVGRLAAAGARHEACRAALANWPSIDKPLRHVRRLLPGYRATLPQAPVRIAGFSTTSTFAEALVPAFAAHGLSILSSEAPFATAINELLAPFPDVQALFLLLDPHAFGEPDWRKGLDKRARDAAARLEAMAEAIPAFAERAGRLLVINTIPFGLWPSMGHLDTVHSAGRAAMTRRIHAVLADLAANNANVVLVDSDLAFAKLAPIERHDPRLWFYGRIGYTEAAMNALARAFATAFAARTIAPVKVIALDLDNTVWGGVYGDDGVERLASGDDPPGNAFKAFQQECLRLKAQGKLLVALSKNNPDAISVFESHPGLLLRADDFAATAIDWQPKPDNVRRLAAELNLGLDSFLFLDDSPHEREAMRRLCPEVRVPEMPADPALRPGWLRMLTETWPLRLTAEDAERPAMYLAERRSRELKSSAASYGDYLRDLDQALVIEPLSSRTLPRVAQLHERTNQFNPTTRRFTEAELAAFMTDTDRSVVLLGRVSDRFGDHGIVIASVATLEGTTARVESLVMSCRVIARTIETAFLAELVGHLARRGVTEVIASYAPTAKNALVRDLYPSHGFNALGMSDAGPATWLFRTEADKMPDAPFVSSTWSRT